MLIDTGTKVVEQRKSSERINISLLYSKFSDREMLGLIFSALVLQVAAQEGLFQGTVLIYV